LPGFAGCRPSSHRSQGRGLYQDIAARAGVGFPSRNRLGFGCVLADLDLDGRTRSRGGYGDFDRDGDLDLLMTTDNGPAVLFRNHQQAGRRSVRFRLVGTRSNRDAIGATVRVYQGGTSQTRMVKSGSSDLSQSELPVTFGVGTRDRVERVVITWPSGRTEEFKDVATGRAYECIEGKGIEPRS
jgi:hypothetical protein